MKIESEYVKSFVKVIEKLFLMRYRLQGLKVAFTIGRALLGCLQPESILCMVARFSDFLRNHLTSSDVIMIRKPAY